MKSKRLGKHILIRGDSLVALKLLPPNSIDSMITDPPYGLSKQTPENVRECLTAWLKGEGYSPRSTHGGFMNKAWDSWVPGPELWRECYRVMKPGAFALVFAGTRTMDLMGMSLRLAGFEVREGLGLIWAFGSGFPKSLNIGKAIDRLKGAKRRIVGSKVGMPGYSETVGNHQALYGKGLGGNGDGKGECEITAPATPEAAQWEGFGSATKPAFEPVLCVRKPCEGTVAQNVLKYGCGGLNIDGCRVGAMGGGTHCTNRGPDGKCLGHKNAGRSTSGETFHGPDTNGGRWPPNLLFCHLPGCVRAGTRVVKSSVLNHDCSGKNTTGIFNPFKTRHKVNEHVGKDGNETVEAWECVEGCPVRELDEQSGSTVSSGGGGKKSRGVGNGLIFGEYGPRDLPKNVGIGDTGGASRFFPCFKYVPKASRSEREAGLKEAGLPAVKGAEAVGRKEGSAGADNPRSRSGGQVREVRNTCPTVKPIALMKWLIRLVTPPHGVCLDLFLGSGTTAIACVKERMRCIGIEKDKTHFRIAVARIRHARRKLRNG